MTHDDHSRAKSNAKKDNEENSSTSTSFTLMSQIVGSSLLSIAYVFSRIGFTLTFFLMPISLAISLYLILGYIEACYLTRSYSYRALTQKVIGPKFAYVLDAMLIILYFGFLTGYIIIASQSFIGILQSFLPSFDSYKWIPYVVKTGVAFLIILPLSLLKSTKLLSAIASVSIFFAMAMAITIPVYYFISLGRNGQVCPRFPSARPDNGNAIEGFFRPAVPWWPSSSKGLGLGSLPMGFLLFFAYIPMIQGNYTAHLVTPPMLDMLKGPLYFRMRVLKLSITIALSLCTFLYILVGFFGALLFGKGIESNILKSFDICNDYWIAVIKVLYALVVCVAYPLVLYPLKLSIFSYIKIDKDIEPKRWYGIFVGLTLLFLVLGFGVTLVYENIAAIFGLLGSLCGGILYFGVPIWVYYKLPVLRAESKNDVGQEFREAADENGVIETEAIGTSLIALMLPGDVKDAITRARSISTAAPVDVNTVEVTVNRSRGISVMRTGSLIGFMRGRTLSSAAANFETPQDTVPSHPATIDTGLQNTNVPLMSGRDRASSFIVNVSSSKVGSRRASMVTKSRNNSSLVNSRFRGSTSQTPRDIDSADGRGNDTPNLPQNDELCEGAGNNTRERSYKSPNKAGIEYTESTEEESDDVHGLPDIMPAVAEAQQVEIGNICGVINKDTELAKMTKGRRAFAITCIVISALICLEGLCINIIDFIGKLD
ncbi:Amino acid permease/transporter family [Giardia duodenalis assemblage B]|uniref:Amino acid permease/transporter family n=2 Tax=Giardia intestinalis TaxID=5741 RepID=A0A132NSA8_GIAIN|nr:Amino acid permease [Giardia intestinalis]KWX12993.1 Amino acid permease/transporter family [Giardia intestinalis assemblage B]